MTGLPGAEPPDMASASGAPLDRLRSESDAAVQRTTPPLTYQLREVLDAAVDRQLRVQAAFEARMPEIQRAAVLADRLRVSGLCEGELEWLVPASYDWGEPGQNGSLLGIPMRVIEGIERLYLGVKVTP